MGAVRAPQRRTNTVAALGEVQADTRVTANAIEIRPLDVREIDPALKHEILEQTTDRIVDDRGHVGRGKPETPP